MGPPSSPSRTPVPTGLLLALGKGDVAAPRDAARHLPPAPLPESCSAPTAEVGGHGAGRGQEETSRGGTHECPSAHGAVWWLLLPGVLGAPLSCLGTKWGQVSVGTELGVVGRGRGPPGASMGEVPAVLTGRGGLGERLGRAARARLHLAVDGGGVVLLLGARKWGQPPPEPPALRQGDGCGLSPAGTNPQGHGGLGKCPSMSPRGTSPVKHEVLRSDAGSCFQGDGAEEGGCDPRLRGLWGHGGTLSYSAGREGLEGRAQPKQEPNSTPASPCNGPGTEFGPRPSASPTYPPPGKFSGSRHTLAPGEHPLWRGRRGWLGREEQAGVSRGVLGGAGMRGRGGDGAALVQAGQGRAGRASQFPFSQLRLLSDPGCEDTALTRQHPPPLAAFFLLFFLHRQTRPSRAPPPTASSTWHTYHLCQTRVSAGASGGGCQDPLAGVGPGAGGVCYPAAGTGCPGGWRRSAPRWDFGPRRCSWC